MAPSDPRQTKFVLDESRIPRAWYNIAADLPVPPSPYLHPATLGPIGPDDLAPLFPMALIGQEVSAEREIEIPEPVRDAYRLYRPSPLYRAHRLERALDTPAHIYYKYEGGSPAGSHKPNTALAQAFYNKEEGVTRLATETGAGQWGSALAFAGAYFGLEVKVYMVRASYDQKPYRRILMETYGAEVVASPVADHELRPVRARPRRPTARARSGWPSARPSRTPRPARTPSTPWARCSTTSCSTRRSSARRRSSRWGWPASRPTSSSAAPAAGPTSPGSPSRSSAATSATGAKHRIIAVEPEAAPSLTRGVYAYDFGDTAQDGAGRQDAHARPRLHPRADPRRRPALPRHVAAGQPAQGARPDRGPQRPPARRASRPASSSPGPRGSCPPPSRPTRSGSRSTRRSRPRRPARRG